NIWKAVFTHSGERVITSSSDGTACVWDARTGTAIHWLKGHDDEVTDLALDERERRVATTSADGTARIWSLETGEPLATLRGHTASVNRAFFAPDDHLVTISGDGTARVWDLARRIQTAVYQHGGFLGRAADLDPHTRHLATSDGLGTVKIWDLR